MKKGFSLCFLIWIGFAGIVLADPVARSARDTWGRRAADPRVDDALRVRVARKTLDRVMADIAADIGNLKTEFPQLKKWNSAEISPNKIGYQYHYKSGASEEEFGENGCNLLITSKDAPLASASSVLPDELKLGVYLKFKATGERAEALKEAVQKIVAEHFENIRALHSNQTLQ